MHEDVCDVPIVEAPGNHIGNDLLENCGERALGEVHVLLRSIEMGGQVERNVPDDVVVEVRGTEVPVFLGTTEIPGPVLLAGSGRTGGELRKSYGRHSCEIKREFLDVLELIWSFLIVMVVVGRGTDLF
jgi:hypothetical protein